jgi:DinB superfamily
MDIRDIDANLERVAADFHELLDSATSTELRAKTNGTKWTNKELLFHMLFGFLLVRALLVLVKGFARLPDAVSGAFAAVLNVGTRPFHVINYLSALPGGRVLRGRNMGRLMDNTIRHLRARLERESSRTLALTMHFPTGWDPYFKDVMTVADIYEYPTKHYDHHRRQLTTRRASRSQPPPVPLT